MLQLIQYDERRNIALGYVNDQVLQKKRFETSA